MRVHAAERGPRECFRCRVLTPGAGACPAGWRDVGTTGARPRALRHRRMFDALRRARQSEALERASHGLRLGVRTRAERRTAEPTIAVPGSCCPCRNSLREAPGESLLLDGR